jgi:hypothetical protein
VLVDLAGQPPAEQLALGGAELPVVAATQRDEIKWQRHQVGNVLVADREAGADRRDRRRLAGHGLVAELERRQVRDDETGRSG